MQECGVFFDHFTDHRWAIKMLPVMAAVFRKRKRSVGSSWRIDETYIKVTGKWMYLCRAIDRAGDTVDFLLTAKRDKAADRRFLERVMIKAKAYAAQNEHSALAPHGIERRDPGPSDVQIQILYCGVCHSDLHTARNEWKRVRLFSATRNASHAAILNTSLAACRPA